MNLETLKKIIHREHEAARIRNAEENLILQYLIGNYPCGSTEIDYDFYKNAQTGSEPDILSPRYTIVIRNAPRLSDDFMILTRRFPPLHLLLSQGEFIYQSDLREPDREKRIHPFIFKRFDADNYRSTRNFAFSINWRSKIEDIPVLIQLGVYFLRIRDIARIPGAINHPDQDCFYWKSHPEKPDGKRFDLFEYLWECNLKK